MKRTGSIGMDRQLAIYLAGLEQRRPELPVSWEELEEKARQVMSPEAYAYVAGSAGGEETARANREAFRRRRIVPRMMRDVSARDLRVSLLGRELPFPLLLAPVGVLGIVHPEGELPVARAAASLGIPFILSTVSSRSLEEVAQAAPTCPRWFQLYWGRDREFTLSLLKRVEEAGYEALVVTLDTKLLAWRERDLQLAYLPFLHAQGLANYMSDPVFRSRLKVPPEENPEEAIRLFASIFSDPSLTWEDLAFLREHCKLPLLVKGILHPDDARLALDHGAQGIIVSNHGGRQLDGAIAALDALPEVARVVGDRAFLLFDSGIRRGSDLLKAAALGARAVLLGRPYVYALALRGEEGVRDFILNLLADLDLSLALSGHRRLEQLGPELLWSA